MDASTSDSASDSAILSLRLCASEPSYDWRGPYLIGDNFQQDIMSFLDESEGVGGETAGDGNPFSLPESDFAGSDANDETAGQRVGLGYADEVSDQNGAVDTGAQDHGAESQGRTSAADFEAKDAALSPDDKEYTESPSAASKQTRKKRTRQSNVSSEGTGSPAAAGHGQAPSSLTDRPREGGSQEGLLHEEVQNHGAEEALLPLQRVVQRGEQIGAARMPGKLDAKRKK